MLGIKFYACLLYVYLKVSGSPNSDRCGRGSRVEKGVEGVRESKKVGNAVLDYELLSRYFTRCTMKNTLDKQEFSNWLKDHTENGECESCFDGSVAAAEAIWKTSIATTKMHYTILLNDGAAKTFIHLNDLQIYGPDYKITKEECLNHVAKRLGMGLKKYCQRMEG